MSDPNMTAFERAGDTASTEGYRVHVGQTLFLLAHVLTRLEDRVLSGNLGLSYRQARILKHVHEGVRSGAELGRIFGVTAAAVSENVESLVRKGLLAREPHETDRRAVNLTLTHDGKRVNADAQDAERSLVTELLGPLSENDVEVLLELMTKLLLPSQELNRVMTGR